MLKGADGKVLEVECETHLKMRCRHGACAKANAFVVKGAPNNFLGRREIQAFGVISVLNKGTTSSI